jgi:hypothetical protein
MCFIAGVIAIAASLFFTCGEDVLQGDDALVALQPTTARAGVPAARGVPSAASLPIGRENPSRARGEFVVGQQMLDQRLKLLVGNRDHFNRVAEGRSLSSLGQRFRRRQTHREDRLQTHALSIIGAPKFLDVSLDELMPGTGGASFPLGPLEVVPLVVEL